MTKILRKYCDLKAKLKNCYFNPCIPSPPPLSSVHSTRSSLRSLQKLHVLLWVRLLNIALSNLLHHKVGIDVDFLAELAVGNAPLAADGEDANRGFGVDEGVDALGDVGEGELVGSL